MKKGFTLIEMLIVIAIIAILSSVFLVGLRGFRGGAYDSRRMADLQKVQSYLEIYYTQKRAYPDVSSWSALQTTLVNADVGITALPNDPLSSAGETYYYCASSNKQSYILGAKLSTPNHSALSEGTEMDSIPSGFSGCNAKCVDSDGGFCIQF